ncbi:ras-specific guanine nucleotide-releasing factor RalGPS2 isoform X1 [Bemisia tabaci]
MLCMANMRYSEMPHDVTLDCSFASLQISNSKKWDRKSENSWVNENFDSGVEVSSHELPLLDSPQSESPQCKLKRHHTTNDCYSKKKTDSSVISYNNLNNAGERHSKSNSLPNNATLIKHVEPILEVLRVPPEDFASQLSLLDFAVFQQISPDELTSCAWHKRNKLEVAPNVVAFTRRFNHVSFWTVQEILKGATPKHRAQLLAYFIRIGKKLFELSNFHSLFAVISAMQSAPIYRLSKTWNHLAKKDKQLFDRLAEIFSEDCNWKHLREYIESLKLPCIPYLGIFLTDLVHIDMAHPHRTGGLESEQRQLKMNNILRIISAFQQSDYTFLPSRPDVLSYLRSIKFIDELQKFVEDDQYKLSLRLEPPSPSLSASKESVVSSCKNSQSLSPTKGSSLLQCSPVSKFVPGHRKCRSLGTKYRSTSLPRNFYKGAPLSLVNTLGIFSRQPSSTRIRHLLDDSVLEELPSSGITPQALKNGGLLEDFVDLPESKESSQQGCLRRKTLMKNGHKPSIKSWQRYWVELCHAALIFYPPKCFSGSERSDYKRDACKTYPINDCIVRQGDSPDVFFLHDPNRCNTYKFRAESQSAALLWYHELKKSLSNLQQNLKPPSANLISFE